MFCKRMRGEDDGRREVHCYARLENRPAEIWENQEKQEKAGKTIEKPGKNEKPLRKHYKTILFTENQ